jgi:hypothetical protein
LRVCGSWIGIAYRNAAIIARSYRFLVDAYQASRDNYGVVPARYQDPQPQTFVRSVHEPANGLTKPASALLRCLLRVQRGRPRSSLECPAAAPAADENPGFAELDMRSLAGSPLRSPSVCFPPASPVFVEQPGKQESIPKGRNRQLISLRNFGAGEGIRTLDPNLGNV